MDHLESLTPILQYHAMSDPLPAGLEFPGCKPVHLPRNEVETYDGRREFRDARTETTWVCEPTSPCHEQPSQTLAALLHAIAAVRASPIKCYAAPNETTPSEPTYAVVDRVGAELNARGGTGPEDDPLLRSQRCHGREDGTRQGRAEGIRQGLEHERALLRRQAALRFDAGTAERLSTVLDGITDPNRLAEVGEWVVRCDNGSELLNRVGAGQRHISGDK